MKNVYEIFDEIKKAPSSDVVKYILFHNQSNLLTQVLQGAFHPNIKFVFKEPVEYKKSDAPPGLGYANLSTEFKRTYLFVENSPKVDPNLTYERKKQILIQLLESLESKEADVYMNMLLKDLKVPGLNYEIVKEVFPGLLP